MVEIPKIQSPKMKQSPKTKIQKLNTIFLDFWKKKRRGWKQYNTNESSTKFLQLKAQPNILAHPSTPFISASSPLHQSPQKPIIHPAENSSPRPTTQTEEQLSPIRPRIPASQPHIKSRTNFIIMTTESLPFVFLCIRSCESANPFNLNQSAKLS